MRYKTGLERAEDHDQHDQLAQRIPHRPSGPFREKFERHCSSRRIRERQEQRRDLRRLNTRARTSRGEELVLFEMQLASIAEQTPRLPLCFIRSPPFASAQPLEPNSEPREHET